MTQILLHCHVSDWGTMPRFGEIDNLPARRKQKSDGVGLGIEVSEGVRLGPEERQ